MPATLERSSPCKVNLLLNILGKRPDGFHELETVMHPVNLCDVLRFERSTSGIQLTCSDAAVPADSGNLVHRAASAFLAATAIHEGVRVSLEKRIPIAAGLGGGSGNAATTLLALNELFGQPLSRDELHAIAAALGSDVPFFLQSNPALATGRGERIQPLDPFPPLRGAAFLLIHPGFGISTAWAYQQLARFPSTLHGQRGRGEKLVQRLSTADLAAAGKEFYNSLEAPALEKFPLLVLYQEFLRANGAAATLMSGSGSTTFAIARTLEEGQRLEKLVQQKFGSCWTAVVMV
jgi:4-diphosphocytidyl-2-C-methyl-D-erythritol kinase